MSGAQLATGSAALVSAEPATATATATAVGTVVAAAGGAMSGREIASEEKDYFVVGESADALAEEEEEEEDDDHDDEDALTYRSAEELPDPSLKA